MNRKVGDDADITLKQPEVHANRVVVVDPSKIAAFDDLIHLLDRAGVDEGVVHQQDQATPLGFVDKVACLF